MGSRSEPCASTEACMAKVVGRLESFSASSAESVAAARAQLAHLRQELLDAPAPDEELSVTAVILFEAALKKLRELLDKLSKDHKEIHGPISKTGKEIDRNFTSDFSGVVRGKLGLEEDGEQRERVNRLVASDLLSQGRLELAEGLASESGVSIPESERSAALLLMELLKSVEDHELGPALAFAAEHRQRLDAMGSRLEFCLHRLRFVQLLQGAPATGPAVQAYLGNFARFVGRWERDVCRVMGAVMFAGPRLAASPYAWLLGEELWTELAAELRKDACVVLGVPAESRLSRVLRAGALALPALLNLRSVMEARAVMSVWGEEELPMDIDLGPGSRFHSVFACPILRQQTTPANPPCRLSCGHVISRDALHKLATNNRTRLKCPYCPVESLVSDAKRLYF